MKPDYTNSIVNLSNSIAQAFGINGAYSSLDNEVLADLDQVENIILLIVDGLGANYLKEKAPHTLLRKHQAQSMTSVFLPSTGSAITSIMTGVAPQQHGVTGWFVYLREYGLVSRILPYSNTIDYNLIGSDISNVVGVKSIFESLGTNYSLILPENITDSVFTRNLTGNATRVKYSDLNQFFNEIRTRVTNTQSKNYIYGYWPGFDAISHSLGSKSSQANQQIIQFDNHLRTFIETIEGTNTKLIITGDHGFNDVPTSNVFYTCEHPKFEECLILPLCGDTRSVYAYVRPHKVAQFENYVQTELVEACELHRSSDLIDENWFGLYTQNPKLSDRVGDYTLIFSNGYAMMNCFPGFEPLVLAGHHGGTSSDEMLVPLCVIDC